MTIATTLWLLALAALLGLLLLVRGWRGRRIDDHPLCRKCGYDLHAIESPKRCPECGCNLAGRRRRICIGHRRVRRLSLALGSVLLALCLGGAGVMIWAAASDFDWTTIKPLSMLKRDADGQDRMLRPRAEQEIMRRLYEDQLSKADIDQIVIEGAAMRQARYLNESRWREQFIVGGWMTASVTDAMFSEYVKALLAGTLRLEIRSNVRSGTRQRIVFHYQPPLMTPYIFPDTGLYLEANLHSVWHGDQKIADLNGAMRHNFRDDWEQRHRTVTSVASIDFAPGMYLLSANCTMRVGIDDGAGGDRHVDLAYRLDDEIAVFSGSNPDVTLDHSESFRMALVNAIDLKWRVRIADDGNKFVECDVAADRLPVAVAFDVVLRDGARMLTIGSFTSPSHRGVSQRISRTLGDEGHWLAASASVEVLLRPSIATAEVTPGIFTIWGGEIEWPRVPATPDG